MLISVYILWLKIAMIIAGKPFDIPFQFSTSGFTSISLKRLGLFQNGQYSRLFLLTISSQRKETPICMSIGPLLTVLKHSEFQHWNGRFFSYYNLTSSYLRDFELLTGDYTALLNTCHNNQVLKFYDENTLNPIWIRMDQVHQICGNQFIERLRLYPSLISVTFGDPSNDGGKIDLKSSSRLIFTSENDDLRFYVTRPRIISDKIRSYMGSNLWTNQLKKYNQVNHNRSEHILSANDELPKHSGSHQEYNFWNLTATSSQTIADPYSAATCDNVSTDLCLGPPRSI